MKSDQTVVLVTGGAKRIGKAIVEDLVAHGFAVAIHCNHSRDEGEELLTDIYAAGGTACVVQADLADSDAVRRLVGDAKDQLGPVQLLVNNASDLSGRWNRQSGRRRGLGQAFCRACQGAGAARRCDGLRPARRQGWSGCQYHRLPRMEAYAQIHVIHVVEIGSLDSNTDACTGTCAAYPRQCYWPRANHAELTGRVQRISTAK